MRWICADHLSRALFIVLLFRWWRLAIRPLIISFVCASWYHGIVGIFLFWLEYADAGQQRYTFWHHQMTSMYGINILCAHYISNRYRKYLLRLTYSARVTYICLHMRIIVDSCQLTFFDGWLDICSSGLCAKRILFALSIGDKSLMALAVHIRCMIPADDHIRLIRK